MKIEFKLKDISNIADKILEKVFHLGSNLATVLALSGDLGAGKTTLTKELGRQLGITENIISPTFVIMKIYEVKPESKYFSKFKKIVHIDAYRLEAPDELLGIGWKEIISEKENLIIIEWPEKVEKHLIPSSLRVSLSHQGNDSRLIEY